MKTGLKILFAVVLVVAGIAIGMGISHEMHQWQTQRQGLNANAPNNSNQSIVNNPELIGEEKAREIALEKARISADGVIFDRVELDIDNGIWQYEVEFKKGFTEYDADIKADDGKILSFEVDIND